MKAFPSTEPIYGNNVVGVKQSNGMDLRDYFAAKALQGILMDGSLNSITYTEKKDITAEISLFAYGFADAMMKAREK